MQFLYIEIEDGQQVWNIDQIQSVLIYQKEKPMAQLEIVKGI